jgi:uncharacterized protein YwgA
MNRQSVAMRLILDELEEPARINSLHDRIRLQKIIYLVQSIGIDLGYGYGWYVRGPYSSSLADDYYNMPSTEDIKTRELKESAKKKLRPLLKVIQSEKKPDELNKTEWLELVASVRFLQLEARLSRDEINAKISKTKPNLFPYIDNARSALKGIDSGSAD